MSGNSIERSVITGFSALATAVWLYIGATFLQASLAMAILCAATGSAIAAGGTWGRYRGGYRTEVETADEASLPDRLASTVAMAAAGG